MLRPYAGFVRGRGEPDRNGTPPHGPEQVVPDHNETSTPGNTARRMLRYAPRMDSARRYF